MNTLVLLLNECFNFIQSLISEVTQSEADVGALAAEVNSLNERLETEQMDAAPPPSKCITFPDITSSVPVVPESPPPLFPREDNDPAPIPPKSIATPPKKKPSEELFAENIQLDTPVPVADSPKTPEPIEAASGASEKPAEEDSKPKDHFAFIGEVLRGGIKDINLRDFVSKPKISKSFPEPFSELFSSKEKSKSVDGKLNETADEAASMSEGSLSQSTDVASPTF
jgi:hypothetical protein